MPAPGRNMHACSSSCLQSGQFAESECEALEVEGLRKVSENVNNNNAGHALKLQKEICSAVQTLLSIHLAAAVL